MRWILNRAKNNLTNFGCPKCITDGTRLHLCTYFRAISFKYKSDSLYCFRCEVSENFPFWLRNQLNLFIINLIAPYFPLHKFMVHKCNLKIFSIAVLHCLLVKFEQSNFWSLFLFFLHCTFAQQGYTSVTSQSFHDLWKMLSAKCTCVTLV